MIQRGRLPEPSSPSPHCLMAVVARIDDPKQTAVDVSRRSPEYPAEVTVDPWCCSAASVRMSSSEGPTGEPAPLERARAGRAAASTRSRLRWRSL